MTSSSIYLLVSLPQSISLSNDHDEALTALRSSVSTDHGVTHPFRIPTFKIGTLDALVQQADELQKLTGECQSVFGKVSDSLSSILEGNQEKIEQQKNVDDKPVQQYLQNFIWNKIKYRIERPIAEIIDILRRDLSGIDNDVKSKIAQYNNTKNSLVAAQRKQTGNLATKSLISIVNPKELVQDSEYIETHLLAVPNQLVKDFWKTYETLAPMVVPRSATAVADDSEFHLFAVTTFKKHSAEFIHKAREKRWTPRDYRYREGGREEEQKEIDELQKQERKLWGEALRLCRTGYSESAMTWMHVFALRVFVESVLRYGLPAEFVCGIIKSNPKLAKKARASLDSTYAYLGGNAVNRDKKGRVAKDDQATASEMHAAGHGDTEYTPYVYYEFEFN